MSYGDTVKWYSLSSYYIGEHDDSSKVERGMVGLGKIVFCISALIWWNAIDFVDCQWQSLIFVLSRKQEQSTFKEIRFIFLGVPM